METFEAEPFDHRVRKNGEVHISRGGRVVTIVRGTAAGRLVAALEAAPSDAAVQHLLARATGNYKRGNERAGRLDG